MVQYYPEIQLHVGDMIYFDGNVLKIVGRASSDSFLVEIPGKKHQEEWHVDQFFDELIVSEHIQIRSDDVPEAF